MNRFTFLLGVLASLSATAITIICQSLWGREASRRNLENMHALMERMATGYPDRIVHVERTYDDGWMPECYYIYNAGHLGDQCNYLCVAFERHTITVTRVENCMQRSSESYSEEDLRDLLLYYDIVQIQRVRTEVECQGV